MVPDRHDFVAERGSKVIRTPAGIRGDLALIFEERGVAQNPFAEIGQLSRFAPDALPLIDGVVYSLIRRAGRAEVLSEVLELSEFVDVPDLGYLEVCVHAAAPPPCLELLRRRLAGLEELADLHCGPPNHLECFRVGDHHALQIA